VRSPYWKLRVVIIAAIIVVVAEVVAIVEVIIAAAVIERDFHLILNTKIKKIRR
jgi:hypothetical protein